MLPDRLRLCALAATLGLLVPYLLLQHFRPCGVADSQAVKCARLSATTRKTGSRSKMLLFQPKQDDVNLRLTAVDHLSAESRTDTVTANVTSSSEKKLQIQRQSNAVGELTAVRRLSSDSQQQLPQRNERISVKALPVQAAPLAPTEPLAVPGIRRHHGRLFYGAGLFDSRVLTGVFKVGGAELIGHLIQKT